MKIYVVTQGSYSDYGISKVFTDKAKAEEYREWLPYSNDIEVYETEDDLIVGKYYEIRLYADIYPNGILGPDVYIEKDICTCKPYNALSDYSKRMRLGITRHVSAENWNEEFYINKYTKVIYDMIAIIKYHLSNGANFDDVKKLITNYKEEQE